MIHKLIQAAVFAFTAVPLAACGAGLERGGGGETVTVAQVDMRGVKQRAQKAQRMIKQRASQGEDVSDFLRRMREANGHFKNGDLEAGKAVLDGVIADLESGTGGAPATGAGTALSSSDWTVPETVRIRGYDGRGDHKMEVGVTASGDMIFFNNSNKNPAKTDIYWATRVGDDDTLFEFQGELGKVNKSGVLDGTPAHDRSGTLAFVSSRVKPPTLYWGQLEDGEVRNIERVPLTLPKPYFALDMEVASNKEFIVFTHRSYKDKHDHDVAFAEWNGREYAMPDNWRDILRNVNTADWEYAPDISADLLEIWFTRLKPGGGPVIYSATRSSVDEPFTNVRKHPTITGLVEAPTLTGDDNTLYYHCKDMSTDTWEVCVTRRKR